MTQTSRNHYVSQWYQRRFLCGREKFFYLDLRPESGITPAGKKFFRRSVLRWGPKRCFLSKDLYTLKLGSWSTDSIERHFFGPIDFQGQSAVEFFSNYSFRSGAGEAFQSLSQYMDAQRARTPRGLDWLQTRADFGDQQAILLILRHIYQIHQTMWTEGVWEVVYARESHTKFLLTDEPVTFFNAKAFPGSSDLRYPNDVGLDEVGTRTIFPLGSDACLIITHVQLTRDPWASPRKPRINARVYSQTLINLLDIQFGRELTDEEVLRINVILKRRATRYIAAAEEEWLYPEEHLPTTHWSKIDHDWFLFPHLYKVPFNGGMVIGFNDGRSMAMDEYGRRPDHPDYQDEKTHRREWEQHLKAQIAWALKREGRAVAHVDKQNFDEAGDSVMADALARYRLRRRINN